jgi:hypothetical protein
MPTETFVPFADYLSALDSHIRETFRSAIPNAEPIVVRPENTDCIHVFLSPENTSVTPVFYTAHASDSHEIVFLRNHSNPSFPKFVTVPDNQIYPE